MARSLAPSAAVAALAVGAALFSACPAKEERLAVSEAGAELLAQACLQPCVDNCCVIQGGTLGRSEQERALKAQIVLVEDAGERRVRALGPCMDLPLACDFEGTGGQDALFDQVAYCLERDINGQLDKHLADGIGFDGLEDDKVRPLIAVYNAPAPAAGPPPTRCVPEHLLACGAFDEVDDDEWDIVCASCTQTCFQPKLCLGGRRLSTKQANISESACLSDCLVVDCQALLARARDEGVTP
jgi:hypothetical protein